MSFKNPSKRFTLVLPEWQEGSEWVFRSEKSGEDDEKIRDMTTQTIVGAVDRKALRKAYQKGEDVDALIGEAVQQKSIMSTQRALLTHMSISWSGPEFTIPETYTTTETDVTTGEVRDVPHELAGSLAPLNEEWIGKMDGFELEEVIRILTRVWAGRKPEEEAAHHAALKSVDRSQAKTRRAS